MRLNIFITIFLSLCFTQKSLSTEKSALVEYPKWVWNYGKDGFNYWFVRHLVMDFEKTIESIGLDFVTCAVYEKQKEMVAFHGLGKCFTYQFFQNMKNKKKNMMIYAWSKDESGKFHRFGIQWVQPYSDWSTLFSDFFEMRLEKPLYQFRRWRHGESDANQLRVQKYPAGEITMTLPDSFTAIKNLDIGGKEVIVPYLKYAKQIKFFLRPSKMQNGKVVYVGKTQITHKELLKTTNMDLYTNMNLVLLKRPFYVHGQINNPHMLKETAIESIK